MSLNQMKSECYKHVQNIQDALRIDMNIWKAIRMW